MMTMKTMMVFEEVFNDCEDIFLNVFDDCEFFDDGCLLYMTTLFVLYVINMNSAVVKL